jgi:cobyric acid synthase
LERSCGNFFAVIIPACGDMQREQMVVPKASEIVRVRRNPYLIKPREMVSLVSYSKMEDFR